jgi:hypothetical protein
MRFGLCSAVARGQARRLRRAVAAAPLPAALGALVVALAPLVLIRIGRAVGGELIGVESSGGVMDALVLGPLLASAVAGAMLAATIPTRSALGAQVAAGPSSDLVALAAGLTVPALLSALVVLPSLTCACVALASELHGGEVAGLALAVAIVAAFACGATIAEGARAAARGRKGRTLAIAAGGLAWALVGRASGSTPLGPLAQVGSALRGSGSSWLALAVAGATAVGLGTAWMLLAATRPEKRAPPVSSRRRPSSRPRMSLPAGVAALVSRRDDVRLATVGAVGFGLAGGAIAVASAAPAPAPFLLATTTALLGSIVCALAGCGVVVAGGWLWLGAPGHRRLLAAVVCSVGFGGCALPVGLVGAAAVCTSGTSWNAACVVAVLLIVGSAVALTAGAAVPWSGTGLGDQLSSLAAFAALAVVASVGIGLTAPRLISLGLPGLAAAPLVCGVAIALALLAVAHRLEVTGR